MIATVLAVLTLTQLNVIEPKPILWKGQTIYSDSHALVVTMGSGGSDLAIPSTLEEGVQTVRHLREKFQFNGSNIVHLDGPSATYEAVREWFINIKARAKKNDCIFVMISLHGVVEDGIPYFKLYKPGGFELVRMTEISKLFRELPSKHTALIGDTCFSGGLFLELETVVKKGRNNDEVLLNASDSPSHIIVTSASESQSAYVSQDAGSRFGSRLLGALSPHRELPVRLVDLIRNIQSEFQGEPQSVSFQYLIKEQGEVGDFLLVPGLASETKSNIDDIERARKLVSSAQTNFDRGYHSESKKQILSALSESSSWSVVEPALNLLADLKEYSLVFEFSEKLIQSGLEVGALYDFRSSSLALLGKFEDAFVSNNSAIEKFGVTSDRLHNAEVLGRVDHRYDKGYDLLVRQLVRDPSDHETRKTLIDRLILNGKPELAKQQLDTLAFWGGVNAVYVKELFVVSSNFGMSSIGLNLVGNGNVLGMRGVDCDMVRLQMLFAASKHSEVLSVQPHKRSSRIQMATFPYIKAVSCICSGDVGRSGEYYAELIKILSAGPTEYDTGSMYSGDIPSSLIDTLTAAAVYENEMRNASKRRGNDDLAKMYLLRQKLEGSAAQRNLAFFHQHDDVIAPFNRRFIAIYLQHFAKNIFTNADIDALEDMMRSNLATALTEKRSNTSAGLEQGAQATLNQVFVSRFSASTFIKPISRLEYAADNDVINYMAPYLAIKKLASKLSTEERKKFMAHFEFYLEARIDDLWMHEALFYLYQLDKDQKNADRIKAIITKKWSWLKLQ